MNLQKIIISRTDSIGDVVLTLPIAGILKQIYPNCRIFFLGQTYTLPILETSQHIDVPLDWTKYEKAPFIEAVNFFKNLRADAIIHIFPNSKIARAAYKAGIPLRIGTSHRLYNWLWCNRPVNIHRKNSDLHESQLNIKLLEPLTENIDFSLKEISQYFGITKISPLKNELSQLIDNKRFNLILHPKSRGSAREWGLENFSHLIEMLPSSQFRIFVTGTPNEANEMSLFLSQYRQRIFNLTGQLSLKELISFINSTDGLVAASTGPLHIAAALGKAAVGIYAPMRPIFPQRWSPVGENSRVLVLDKKCNDCRKTQNCKCIREISPADVKKVLLQLYEKKFGKPNNF